MQRFLKNSSGNIAIMSAVAFPVMLLVAAFAVDEGALTLQRREMQTIADQAAVYSAANIGKAEQAAKLVLSDNHFGSSSSEKVDILVGDAAGVAPLKVEKGHYVADPTIAAAARFVVGAPTPNAVRVTLQKKGKLYFASMFTTEPVIEVSSTAHADAEAAFSIGSRLLKLDDGILNGILNSTLGTNVSLTVMDYNALISGDVKVLDFFDALATNVKFKGGTYNELLNGSASVGDIANALASSSNSTGAAKALTVIAVKASGAQQVSVPLSHLFKLGGIGQLAVGSGSSAFDAKANIMSILTASGAVGNGDHQVHLNLGANVPGLASVTADLTIGEPPQYSPWFSVGEMGSIIRTAQTRLSVVATVGGSGALAGAKIRIPIYLELAYGEASLADVSCPAGAGSANVTVNARPGIADLYIADVNPADMTSFDAKPTIYQAQIVQSALLNVTGSAHVNMGNLKPTPVTFSGSDISQGVIKTVTTKNYAASALSSLIGDLNLNINTAGLSIASPALVQQSLAGVLAAAAAPVDSVVYNLLTALGISLGQADIRVTGINCRRAVLVQ